MTNDEEEQANALRMKQTPNAETSKREQKKMCLLIREWVSAVPFSTALRAGSDRRYSGGMLEFASRI
jgi:hypothetical protein